MCIVYNYAVTTMITNGELDIHYACTIPSMLIPISLWKKGTTPRLAKKGKYFKLWSRLQKLVYGLPVGQYVITFFSSLYMLAVHPIRSSRCFLPYCFEF
jgi:hypothetical protein